MLQVPPHPEDSRRAGGAGALPRKPVIFFRDITHLIF